jgi:hypothetical protein
MNEMELLLELAQETPLPAPAELGGARARLVAAITTDPPTYGASAAAQAAVDQPGPSTGQSAGPLQPPAPKPVLAAARFMYGGAVTSAAYVIATLPFMGDIHGTVLGHRITATPLTIAVVIVVLGLVPIALWLWMARAVGQGRNWARILSTVLFTLATLQLIESRGVAQLFCAALTWLSGLAAVWLLWRPASSAFFRSARAARPPSQISGP